MDLLERAALLEELSGALADTAAEGRVVLVAGEAGIGKSTLVRRFTEGQAAQARFLLGACDPLLTPRGLGPLHDIARQTGGRLAELLASGSPREAVFAALLDQLVRPPRQVVVVEDVHWADEATLDLLVFLGRRLERTPAMLIVTYRDDEVGPDHPLRGVLGALPQGGQGGRRPGRPGVPGHRGQPREGPDPDREGGRRGARLIVFPETFPPGRPGSTRSCRVRTRPGTCGCWSSRWSSRARSPSAWARPPAPPARSW